MPTLRALGIAHAVLSVTVLFAVRALRAEAEALPAAPAATGVDKAGSVAAMAACECVWEDNRWLYLVDDLLLVFGAWGITDSGGGVGAAVAPAPAALVAPSSALLDPTAKGANETRLSGSPEPRGLRLLHELVGQQGLCRVEPALMVGTNGVKKRFDEAWVNATVDAAARSRGSTHAEFLKELCLPAQLALDLLCSQYLVVAGAHAAPGARRIPGSRQAFQLRASQRVRRLRALLPHVRGCLATSPWPLDAAALEVYAQRWGDIDHIDENDGVAHRANGGTSTPVPIFDMEVTMSPSEHARLPGQLRRCLPLRERQCWPREATSLSQSCTRCCDPRFPRGHTVCFAGAWTFEACCTPDDLSKDWAPAPPPVEIVHSGKEPQRLQALREELRRGCIAPQASQRRAHQGRAAAWAELRRWVANARSQHHGLQRVFPELDMFVSTKACVAPEVEIPWFIVKGKGSSKGAVDADTDSGVALAAALDAICGPGTPVAGELVAHAGVQVTVPCERSPLEPGLHRLEPYGLELMRSCDLAGGKCPCAAAWCDGVKNCCREGAGTEWRGLGLLTGELRTNIAHFARDALWLHRLLRGNATIVSLSANRPEEELDLVLTKHAATECIENGQCVKTGRQTIFDMERLLLEVSLQGVHPVPRVFHAGDPTRTHPVCFELVVQRWRPWAGDFHSIQSFRSKALHKCGIKDQGMKRKIVVLRRDSSSRQWRDNGAVNRDLEILARAMGSSLFSVSLGHLEPCKQIDVLHDAMLLLGVHGADLTNMIFLPRGAAVVEVAVECEVEGGSVDTPFWRGPGTLINSSVYEEAVGLWRHQSTNGRCPRPGESRTEWLQGFPVSQFAKLARQANLLYTAVMDCGEVAATSNASAGSNSCEGREMADVWDRGWCSSDIKKKQYVDVDFREHLLPTIWAVFEEYLRQRTRSVLSAVAR